MTAEYSYLASLGISGTLQDKQNAYYGQTGEHSPVSATTDTLTGGILFSAGSSTHQPETRFKSKGAIISMLDGARGETVLSETQPASGGTNAASTVARFTTPTRRVYCATDATNGTVRVNAPAGKFFGRFTSQDQIAVLLYIEACNSADTLIVTLSNDNMTSGSSVTVSINANKAPGYWWQVIDASAFVGIALPYSINAVRAKITRSGAIATAAHICGIIKSQRHKPTVIIDFDDAFASQYTHSFQVMQSYGLVGNVAVIGTAVGQSAGGLDAYDYCTLKQLQDMQAAGWGMLTHGYYPHNQGGTMNSYALIKADVAENLAYVQANLPGDGALHYVLPAGQQHASTDQVLSELGFLTCRGTIGEQTAEQPGGVDNAYRLFGTPISATAGLANMKSKFDTARKCGTTIRYQGHRIVSSIVDAGNELLDTEFENFCAYIAPFVASGEVANMTVGQWELSRLR